MTSTNHTPEDLSSGAALPSCPVGIVVQVPVTIPTGHELQAIVEQATKEYLRERDEWLTIDEAAAYLKMSRRTFDEYRKKWRILVSEFGKLIYRADLDHLVAAQAVQPPGNIVIAFPSLKLREHAAQPQGGNAA